MKRKLDRYEGLGRMHRKARQAAEQDLRAALESKEAAAVDPLRKENDELRGQVDRLTTHCRMLAMLSADEPQFYNPMQAAAAKIVRDQWLAKETPDAT